MALAVVTLRISLPSAHSLKDKRRIVKSLKERLRNRFNVSVAETDYHDVWQTAEVSVATVSPDGAFAQSTVDRVADFVRADARLALVDYEIEVF
jgi:uncharacterized protein YlxP (DUF503 family)